MENKKENTIINTVNITQTINNSNPPIYGMMLNSNIKRDNCLSATLTSFSDILLENINSNGPFFNIDKTRLFINRKRYIDNNYSNLTNKITEKTTHKSLEHSKNNNMNINNSIKMFKIKHTKHEENLNKLNEIINHKEFDQNMRSNSSFFKYIYHHPLLKLNKNYNLIKEKYTQIRQDIIDSQMKDNTNFKAINSTDNNSQNEYNLIESEEEDVYEEEDDIDMDLEDDDDSFIEY
jgi:hypothetical protein